MLLTKDSASGEYSKCSNHAGDDVDEDLAICIRGHDGSSRTMGTVGDVVGWMQLSSAMLPAWYHSPAPAYRPSSGLALALSSPSSAALGGRCRSAPGLRAGVRSKKLQSV